METLSGAEECEIVRVIWRVELVGAEDDEWSR